MIPQKLEKVGLHMQRILAGMVSDVASLSTNDIAADSVSRDLEGFLKRTAIAYRQNSPLFLGFRRRKQQYFLKKSNATISRMPKPVECNTIAASSENTPTLQVSDRMHPTVLEPYNPTHSKRAFVVSN